MAKRTIQVLDQQTLVDIAIQEYGSAEALFTLFLDDHTLPSITEPLVAGQLLKATSAPIDVDVRNFFQARILKPVTGPLVPLPFECVGDGYSSHTISGTGTISAYTSSGYFTLRNADTGAVTTHESGDVVVPGEASYCMWPSDAEGADAGTMLLYVVADGINTLTAAGNIETDASVLDGPAFSGTTLDLSELTGFADYLYLTAPNLSNVTIGAGLTFALIDIQNAALTAASVDALCNALAIAGGQASNLSGGTSAAPTVSSLDNRTAYIGTGSTLTTN